MKFKMSEKSLFAILLRAPWWVSFSIGVMLALLARVFLPENLRVVGMLSGLPFCVLSVFAAWKQRNKPSPESVAMALTHLANMSVKEFLPTIEKVFAKQGFVVSRLNLEAADLRLEKSGKTTLVSCKRWKAATLGVDVLRDLKALQMAQAVDHTACISLSLPTGAALQFSKENAVQLICQDALASLYLASMKDQGAV